jgi:precorrin-3B methylase
MKTDMSSPIFLDFSHIKVPDILKPSSDIIQKIQQIWLIKWENVLNG